MLLIPARWACKRALTFIFYHNAPQSIALAKELCGGVGEVVFELWTAMMLRMFGR